MLLYLTLPPSFSSVKYKQSSGIIDLDAKDENNATALHRACENGQYELVVWMLRNGAAVNLQDKSSFFLHIFLITTSTHLVIFHSTELETHHCITQYVQAIEL